ncbi:BatD family protein [Cupriavidus sp. 2KB_3]|uniref:BatD family protein n=1 Tax=Cupriavidus sp. 2KB_3 TaxID=3232980 RepID=UPI003F932C8B
MSAHGMRHALATVLLCAAMLAHAAGPSVRVRVVGPQPVVAGQSVQVEVTVLAPNFFLSAPAFPVLQIPGAVVTMPDDRGINSTETIDGASFAGIRKTYVVTPQGAGDFTLPPTEFRFTHAGDDGKPQTATVTLPPATIHATGQAAQTAQAGNAGQGTEGSIALPAGALQVTQQFDKPIDGDSKLRAGDALVRTITIVAPGTPAMMIAPPAPPALQPPRGVRQFRADPVLQDDASGGRRTETITYVFEDSGRHTLPAVPVSWYDAATGRRATSTAPAVTVNVARAAPGLGLSPSGGLAWRPPAWLDEIDWRVTGAIVLAAVVLGYGLWRWRRGHGAARAAWRARWHRTMETCHNLWHRSGLPPLNPGPGAVRGIPRD